MLDHQYRMHPFISSFSSTKFYGCKLKDGINEQDRVLKTKFQFINKAKPAFLISCKDYEQTSSTGYSYLNRKEGSIIGKLVSKMVREGVMESQIGIITPYEGKLSYLSINLINKFFLMPI